MSSMSLPLPKVDYLPRTTCPLHVEGSDRLVRVASVDDRMSGQTYEILRCPVCGVALTTPYPSEATVKYLYEGRASVSNFDPIQGTIMDRLKDFFARVDIRRAHAIAGKPAISSILDFGAGFGRFAFAGKRCFPESQVTAVDFDLDPPPTFERCPRGVAYLPYEAFLKTTEQFDLIILRAVIEHVHDPINLLRMLKGRMTPNGILYIEAPNFDSAYIHYFGRDTNAYGVPYHLFNFDHASIKSVIHSAGLDAKIFYNELPLAGCVLAAKLKQERQQIHQLAGMVLHPVQLFMEWRRGKYIIAAVCRKA